MQRFYALLFAVLYSCCAFAQELPPILKYSPGIYEAGNQNWMIAQDSNHFLYFANNEGLLEYNGADWTLNPTPNETIMRSVKVIGDRIYSGCYMEFGYWKRQQDGHLKYRSLSTSIKSKLIDDEQFWNILDYDQWIVFQSLHRLYIYDTKSGAFRTITPKDGVYKAYKANNNIFFQTYTGALYQVENGKENLVSNDPVFLNNKIVNILYENDSFLIQTQLKGFYRLNDNALTKWATEADEVLNQSSVYSSQKLSDGGYALGCVSNGTFIISKEGKVLYHLTQNKGLANNTALSLFEDHDKNLWIGLDNGINCINLKSPVHTFSDDTGVLGTVYASILHNGKLYIGTNQGLFCRDYQSNEPLQFIPGTKGQVWSLFEYQGTLFCGHDTGTYLIEGLTSKNIFSASGTWKFRATHNPNLLLQGNYYGVSVLEKQNGSWTFRNKISGFGYSSRFFELTKNQDIYVSHEYKGIFRFHTDFVKATSLFVYKEPAKGKNASLIKYDDKIYYASRMGIYKLNEARKIFVKDELLSHSFGSGEYVSGKMTVDAYNRLWIFTRNYINYYEFGKLNAKLKQNTIPIPATLTSSMQGFENISALSRSNYLIGTTDGYYTLNIDDLNFGNYRILLTGVASNKQNHELKYASLSRESEFRFAENNLTFNYTIPEYNKYISAEYQYKLEGLQDEWTNWTTRTSINFKNLSPGDYRFHVRAKIGNSLSENEAVYAFTILKPWYATNLAIMIYLVLAFIAAYFINKSYRNYYKQQREKLIEENNLLLEIKELENEQDRMKMRNLELIRDVDVKSRELAVSNMNLVQKNELLAVIKEDLKKSADNSENRSIKSVITTISKNIGNEDNWNTFREAFDNADKDFIKKIKEAHAQLTPNDLRLCAYLRLNLSSKEIAPLLNISVRSVEIKRYRLRKKMELSHEQGLVEYILSI